MKKYLLVAVMIASITASDLAFAHKPFFSDGIHGSADTAYEIDDITTSIVLYHEVTCETPQLWMRFDTTGGDEPLFFQLGIPVIERLGDYRPKIALLAPGLPKPEADMAAALPFSIPDGMGVLSWSAGETREFFEPFTRTSSLILVERTVPLPEAGQGFLVAWHPQSKTGKLWAAVGTEERFGPPDFATLPRKGQLVRAFHETDISDSAAASISCEQ